MHGLYDALGISPGETIARSEVASAGHPIGLRDHALAIISDPLAKQDYDQRLAVGEPATSLLNVGISLWEKGDYTNAIQTLSTISVIAPSLLTGSYFVAQSQLAMGRIPEAVITLEKLVTLMPGSSCYQSALATAYKEWSKTDPTKHIDAERHFKRAKELGTNTFAPEVTAVSVEAPTPSEAPTNEAVNTENVSDRAEEIFSRYAEQPLREGAVVSTAPAPVPSPPQASTASPLLGSPLPPVAVQSVVAESSFVDSAQTEEVRKLMQDQSIRPGAVPFVIGLHASRNLGGPVDSRALEEAVLKLYEYDSPEIEAAVSQCQLRYPTVFNLAGNNLTSLVRNCNEAPPKTAIFTIVASVVGAIIGWLIR
jgi:tetratricopeptide (TPR) repeat protein